MNNYLFTSAEILGWKLEIPTRAKTSNNIKMPGWREAEWNVKQDGVKLSIRVPL